MFLFEINFEISILSFLTTCFMLLLHRILPFSLMRHFDQPVPNSSRAQASTGMPTTKIWLPVTNKHPKILHKHCFQFLVGGSLGAIFELPRDFYSCQTMHWDIQICIVNSERRGGGNYLLKVMGCRGRGKYWAEICINCLSNNVVLNFSKTYLF